MLFKAYREAKELRVGDLITFDSDHQILIGNCTTMGFSNDNAWHDYDNLNVINVINVLDTINNMTEVFSG